MTVSLSRAARPGPWLSRWLPPDGYARFCKRGLDVALVVAAAPVAVPVVCVLAAAVALDGGMPFSTHARVGRAGRTFRIRRLRSMARGAEARVVSPAVPPQDDPRVTRLGRLMRRTSLDELPLLWNVLVGDMSLVGPRPLMPGQRSLYPGLSYGRLRPGLTGFWQTAGHHRTTFAARAECDAAYAAALSLRTDARLLRRLLAAVLQDSRVRI